MRARENETPRYFAKLIGATLEDVLGAMKMSDNLRFKKGTKVYLPTAAAVDYKRRADEARAQAVAKAKAVEAAAAEAAAAEAAAAEAALNVEDEPLTVEYANGEQGQVFADRAATAKAAQAAAAQAAAAQAAAPEVAKEAEEAGRGEEDVSGSGAADGMSLASVVQRLQDAVAALQAEQE